MKNIDLLKEYEAWLKMKNYKPRGIEENIRYVRQFLVYLEKMLIDVQEVGLHEAEGYREYIRLLVNEKRESRYNPKTINRMFTCLRSFYSFLVKTQKVYGNPFLDVDAMRVSESLPKNILTVEEMGKVLDAIEVKSAYDFKFKVVAEVLYATGMRISELEHVVAKDYDSAKGSLVIRDDKSRKDRVLILTEYSNALLKVYKKHMYNGSDQLFEHGKSRALNVWMNRRLKYLSNKLEVPSLTCHGMRHSIATHLLNNGADLREVQEFLGHGLIKNTEIYTKIFPDDLKKVIDKNHPRECGPDEKNNEV